MEPWQILFFLSFFGLPGALWFALDARMAKLNPWVWALWGMLALFVPTILIQRLMQLLTKHGLSVSNFDPPWSKAMEIVGACVLLALVVMPIATIHKRVLKPRRLEVIGPSLNYVGGWLGTLIIGLLTTAVGSILLYVPGTIKQIDYFCRHEKTWQSFLDCIVSFRIETLGTTYTIISVIVPVAGSVWAALALSYKKPSAVRITGYLLVIALLLNLVHMWQETTQVLTHRAKYPFVSTSAQPKSIASQALLMNIVWLVYLIRSRRVREVFGRNFGE